MEIALRTQNRNLVAGAPSLYITIANPYPHEIRPAARPGAAFPSRPARRRPNHAAQPRRRPDRAGRPGGGPGALRPHRRRAEVDARQRAFPPQGAGVPHRPHQGGRVQDHDPLARGRRRPAQRRHDPRRLSDRLRAPGRLLPRLRIAGRGRPGEADRHGPIAAPRRRREAADAGAAADDDQSGGGPLPHSPLFGATRMPHLAAGPELHLRQDHGGGSRRHGGAGCRAAPRRGAHLSQEPGGPGDARQRPAVLPRRARWRRPRGQRPGGGPARNSARRRSRRSSSGSSSPR